MGSAGRPEKAKTSDGPDEAVDPDVVPAAEDEPEVKRKFREALERKQSRGAGSGAPGDGGDQSRVSSAHGPAHQQRQFRRKSG